MLKNQILRLTSQQMKGRCAKMWIKHPYCKNKVLCSKTEAHLFVCVQAKFAECNQICSLLNWNNCLKHTWLRAACFPASSGCAKLGCCNLPGWLPQLDTVVPDPLFQAQHHFQPTLWLLNKHAATYQVGNPSLIQLSQIRYFKRNTNFSLLCDYWTSMLQPTRLTPPAWYHCPRSATISATPISAYSVCFLN